MENEFSSIVNVDFTAQMETDLDRVEEGTTDWVQTLREFYGEFEKNLEDAEKKMGSTRLEVPDQVTDIICENCGRHMVIKVGRYGKFLACPAIPSAKIPRRLCRKRRRLPGVRRQNPRQKVQKGQDLFWLRAQSPVPVYDLGTNRPKKNARNAAPPCSRKRAGAASCIV